jgi:hypothetical protein
MILNSTNTGTGISKPYTNTPISARVMDLYKVSAQSAGTDESCDTVSLLPIN